MSLLPARRDDLDGPNSRQLARARNAQEATELELFRYHLQARARAEMDQIDAEALGDALEFALDKEFELFDKGMAKAGTSATKLELLQTKLQMESSINNRRANRRFGL